MPAKDFFHNAAKNALIKEGWTITHDPLFVQYGGVEVFIDLGAEKMIAAQMGDKKIAVEIKSFINTSVISDFHLAVGQFINYRVSLEEEDKTRIFILRFQKIFTSHFFL